VLHCPGARQAVREREVAGRVHDYLVAYRFDSLFLGLQLHQGLPRHAVGGGGGEQDRASALVSPATPQTEEQARRRPEKLRSGLMIRQLLDPPAEGRTAALGGGLRGVARSTDQEEADEEGEAAVGENYPPPDIVHVTDPLRVRQLVLLGRRAGSYTTAYATYSAEDKA
jgi:hypothetical protein